MLFRRVVTLALLVGLASGLVLTIVQSFHAVPIIAAAESLEGGHGHSHGHDHGHGHSHGGWSYTLLSNGLMAIGFGLLLLVGMAAMQLVRGTVPGWKHGLFWGLAGFTAFFVTPALGLPPEIPGQQSAYLLDRQVWWLFAVTCTIVGLGVLAFVSSPWRYTGLLLLPLPYLIGAPTVDGPLFPNVSADERLLLEGLRQEFILATSLANLVFWVALGALAGWAANRWPMLDAESPRMAEPIFNEETK